MSGYDRSVAGGIVRETVTKTFKASAVINAESQDSAQDAKLRLAVKLEGVAARMRKEAEPA